MFGNAKEIQELRESFAHMGAMVVELKSQSAFFKSKISSLNSQIAAMSEKVESLEALLAQKSDNPASSAETMTAQQPVAPANTVLYLSAPAADGTHASTEYKVHKHTNHPIHHTDTFAKSSRVSFFVHHVNMAYAK